MDSMYYQAVAAVDIPTVKSLLQQTNEMVVKGHNEISLLIPMNFCIYQPWLKGYNGQDRALSGQAKPLMEGFYTSRFWIDQNLKKSMGY